MKTRTRALTAGSRPRKYADECPLRPWLRRRPTHEGTEYTHHMGQTNIISWGADKRHTGGDADLISREVDSMRADGQCTTTKGGGTEPGQRTAHQAKEKTSRPRGKRCDGQEAKPTNRRGPLQGGTRPDERREDKTQARCDINQRQDRTHHTS